jgi:pimeloyl-ACP methyl ester carboxylesterase
MPALRSSTASGPAILLTHSQSGTFGWLVADARPALVKAIVALEPSGTTGARQRREGRA